jgi:hypothetical protein
LSFNRFIAVSAVPAFMRVFASGVALQKLPYQIIRPREFAVVNNPHLAQIRGQFADTAGEIFAANDG